MRDEGTRGFTLVELLAVIAILAILSALLLPSAASYVRRGNIAKSASNLRQLGTLTNLYVAENNGRLPVYDFTNPDYSWVLALHRLAYGKDFPDFKPWETGENLKGTIFYSPMMQESEGTPLRSYGINANVRRNDIPASQDNRITLMQVSKPSKTLLYADTKHTSTVGGAQGMTFRNDGKVIICFVDGHVEMREASEVPETTSVEGATFWRCQ